MQIFYAPGITGSTYTLDERESKHTVKVLRMKKGSSVRLIDGKGNLYNGYITDPDVKHCKITIESVVLNYEPRNYRLHIALSPLKNPERFEWFVEKSVEIGIDEISPLVCSKTEKTGIKTERINNIIVSAMKQSLKAEMTRLNEPSSFLDFISRGHRGIKMIAHCSNKFKRTSVSDIYNAGKDALILIGPEGDFTDSEIEQATEKGFVPVHLGKSRLRTETAGVAACHSIYFLNQ